MSAEQVLLSAYARGSVSINTKCAFGSMAAVGLCYRLEFMDYQTVKLLHPYHLVMTFYIETYMQFTRRFFLILEALSLN